MSHAQHDRLRLEQLRAMEHRELAKHALTVEEQLRMRLDRRSTIIASLMLAAALVGALVGYLVE